MGATREQQRAWRLRNLEHSRKYHREWNAKQERHPCEDCGAPCLRESKRCRGCANGLRRKHDPALCADCGALLKYGGRRCRACWKAALPGRERQRRATGDEFATLCRTARCPSRRVDGDYCEECAKSARRTTDE